MVEDGLVHRFVTIIGHHRPGARRQPSGIVSPVKKRGSPPPPDAGVERARKLQLRAAHGQPAVQRKEADDEVLAGGRGETQVLHGPIGHIAEFPRVCEELPITVEGLYVPAVLDLYVEDEFVPSRGGHGDGGIITPIG